MQQYVDDLSGYKRGRPNSQQCFLDSRYFNLVFQRYPGLRSDYHLMIKDRRHKHKHLHQNVHKEKVFLFHTEQNKPVNNNFPGIAKLTITTESGIKHCNLLIFDYENKILYRLEPLSSNGPHFEEINNFLEQMMDEDYELININLTEVPESNPACRLSGYCVAYCILYAYSFLTQTPFEPEHVRKFSAFLERKYGPLPPPAQAEYGDNNTAGTILGGTTGAILGGSLFGPIGLVGGAIGGGLLGSKI